MDTLRPRPASGQKKTAQVSPSGLRQNNMVSVRRRRAIAAGTRDSILPVRHSFVTASAVQDVATRPEQPHGRPVQFPAQVPHRSPRRPCTIILAQDNPGPGQRADFNAVGHIISLSGQKNPPRFPRAGCDRIIWFLSGGGGHRVSKAEGRLPFCPPFRIESRDKRTRLCAFGVIDQHSPAREL